MDYFDIFSITRPQYSLIINIHDSAVKFFTNKEIIIKNTIQDFFYLINHENVHENIPKIYVIETPIKKIKNLIERFSERSTSYLLTLNNDYFIFDYKKKDPLLKKFIGESNLFIIDKNYSTYILVGHKIARKEVRRCIELVISFMQIKKDNIVVHSSAIEYMGRGILFIGGPGTGKSTIALGFVRKGSKFLSGNTVFIQKSGNQLEISAFPRTMDIHVGTIMQCSELIKYIPRSRIKVLNELNINKILELDEEYQIDIIKTYGFESNIKKSDLDMMFFTKIFSDPYQNQVKKAFLKNEINFLTERLLSDGIINKLMPYNHEVNKNYLKIRNNILDMIFNSIDAFKLSVGGNLDDIVYYIQSIIDDNLYLGDINGN